ncbi:hypothetical protein ACHHYP_05274 [Achlya hypogyna]|uniref:Secreted protein n=1 Tax=Achlya hypogyna TaxID=1202772 RepID=A0A0A7CNL6_ACHHY|nr:secreted protein [Achlya hypogyna]OQR90764.1 hypothetical protein ACHHYP_05274 [Achlya hypogyna]
MRLAAYIVSACVAIQAAAMSAYDDSAAQAALAKAEKWVGLHLVASRDEAGSDASAIVETEIGYEPVRIIRNRGFTEDLVFGRLNIKLDEQKVITKVWIG